jgi:mono/diheme cytochrome c family protein
VAAAAALAGCGSGRAPPSSEEILARGKELYDVSCGACHGFDGRGREGVGSPLAGSEWVLGPPGRLIRIALHGVRGPIEVRGVRYNLEMPAMGHVWDDAEMAALLSYVRSAWGNRAPAVSAVDVEAVRRASASRRDTWTAEELSGS